MALAFNSGHALASKVGALIAVDPSTNALVDLKRAGVTFTLDAGVTVVTDATYGAAVRTTGNTGAGHAGFSFTPGLTQASNVAGFKSTLFLVMAKLAQTADDLANHKNNSMLCHNGYVYQALPVVTSAANGRKLGLNAVSTDDYNAARTSNISIYGDGLRHTIATTSANATGGNAVVGKLYVDGANTGVTYSGGTGGDATISAVNGLNNSSAGFDLLYLVIFNDVLTDAEISDLHASVGNNNVFGLVTGAGPVASAPTGTVTIGTVTPAASSVSVPYGYSGSDATGYEYRLNSGTATAIGASPATISGLTPSTAYTLQIRATNATGAGAWSAITNFSTSASGSSDSTVPTLTGAVTVSSLGSSSYTASWPAASDNVAVTGYEYRLNSAATWTSVGTSTSANIAGRTPGSTDAFEVRAFDAAGNRSTALSKSVTLTAAVTGTVAVSQPIKNNAGVAQGGLTGVTCAVLRASDMTVVTTVTGLTTDGTGVLAAISHASIVAGTQYHVAIKTSGGGTGITGPITAS
ncbi:MAG: hypothetical protein L6Q69_18105 [Zoogloea sp.]|nr:hypothetical protein [Zoogloea sp.]